MVDIKKIRLLLLIFVSALLCACSTLSYVGDDYKEENTQTVKTNEDFAAMFREKCCTQNGDDIDGLNAIDDAQLSYFLSNKATNIVFYSPYGMEVGYSYETTENGSSIARGWVTITLQEYEDYLL